MQKNSSISVSLSPVAFTTSKGKIADQLLIYIWLSLFHIRLYSASRAGTVQWACRHVAWQRSRSLLFVWQCGKNLLQVNVTAPTVITKAGLM